MKIILLVWTCLCSGWVFAAGTAEISTPKEVHLPPMEGVTDLSFKDFYQVPNGPRGLQPSARLLSLNNRRVRITGYMAQEDDPTPGIFMLTPRPVKVGEKADGMADDLPASTLFVHMPKNDQNKILTFRPSAWVLTGTLQLGNQEESNDRISFARLIMEPRDIADSKN